MSSRANTYTCKFGPSYPGASYLHPKIHNSPNCLNIGGWHDIAGALTHKGIHHVFQGCPSSGGWHHASSKDLVHWDELGISMPRTKENYHGMNSYDSPCSGFVTVDDNGTPCAGFRQCSSDKGVRGGEAWDVPLELRCATDDTLTTFGEPIYLFDVFYYRGLPYDPVRPWIDNDGNWYATIATDGCNSTTKRLPCAAGGQLDLYSSPLLHGPGSNWTHIGPMFTSNITMLDQSEHAEFVTPEYLGNIPGDTKKGATRIVTNNDASDVGSGTTMYFIGTQENGGRFLDKKGGTEFASPGEKGMMDWGSFTPDNTKPYAKGLKALKGGQSRGLSMARTLGSDANQVAKEGRRVLIGWLGGGAGASQTLAQDLSLSDDGTLLQAFVPELKILRKDHTTLDNTHKSLQTGMQLEIFGTFEVTDTTDAEFGVSVLGIKDSMPYERSRIGINLDRELAFVDGTTQGNSVIRAGPLQGSTSIITIHAYIDHCILAVIINNQTGLTVQIKPSERTNYTLEIFGDARSKVDVYTLNDANNNHESSSSSSPSSTRPIEQQPSIFKSPFSRSFESSSSSA